MLTRCCVGLCVALASLAASSCEQVPLLAPSASTITVSTSASTLPIGGSATVSAFVSESSGTPVQNGTLVRFTATLGQVDPVEVETRGGTATTTFIAGNLSGVAEIRATSGGATGGTGSTPTNVVSIQIGAAAAGSVVLSASPARVPPSGGTVTLIAAALDTAGNRLVGVPITFSTDAGTLSATSAVTDSSGEARVSLTTNRESNVTARAGDKTSSVVRVELGIATSLVLATSPAAPLAGTPVTLTITPGAGTAPRVVINWGDGRTEDLGIVAAARNVTHVYQTSGSYAITATATGDGDTFMTSTSVTVSSAAAVTVSDPTPANPQPGTAVVVTITPTAGTTPRVVVAWGDGTQEDLGVVTGARSVTHAYLADGNYLLTVSSTAGGDTFNVTKVVIVRSPVVVSVSASSTNPARCESVTFTATASEPISFYRWTVDGAVAAESSNTLTRSFTTQGTKIVSVTATTSDGRTGNGQTQVIVQNTPPTAACP
jgi:adhesin/invasin